MKHVGDEKEDKKLGLGDKVEAVIQKIAPKLAEKVKKNGCNCEKRKVWLNNFGANFG
jgi:hypothetical protein